MIIDINSKYPKILPSYINELQQPGNQSPHVAINNWAKGEVGKLNPLEILPLTPFRIVSTPVPSYQSTSVYVQPNLIQPIYNQNIPQVSMQQEADTSNINHQMASDPDFKRWLWLANNNMKGTTEYTRLYDRLRKKYNITPIQVLEGYRRF
jgi:hypothetical protein